MFSCGVLRFLDAKAEHLQHRVYPPLHMDPKSWKAADAKHSFFSLSCRWVVVKLSVARSFVAMMDFLRHTDAQYD